jgi:hypothetical protein
LHRTKHRQEYPRLSHQLDETKNRNEIIVYIAAKNGAEDEIGFTLSFQFPHDDFD